MVTLIDIYEELNRSPKRKQRLDEVTRKNLVGKTKYQSIGRYNRRKNYTVDTKYNIDVQKFINDDMIAITAHVGKYECTVAFEGVIENVVDIVQHRAHNNLTLADVYKALYKCIDAGDIYVNCTCADYCLHEDTEIKLLNGVVDTIKNIKQKFDDGEELYVYSTDANGDFKPGKVSDVWISGYVNDMVKITLDNGKEIITTPEHKYMLRNGEYEQAQNLQKGTSLMKDHQVENVEFIHYDESIPVYDLTVDDYNNFYVDAGVVLHNCYRFKYWATRLGYQYGAGERRPAHITNPRNNIGSFCKHLTKLLADKSWLKKCSGVVNLILKDNIEEVREKFGLEEDELTVADTKMNLKQYRKKQEPIEEPEEDENEGEETPTEEVEVEPEETDETETEEEPEEDVGEDDISEPMKPTMN